MTGAGTRAAVADHPRVVALARIGWLAKGIVYALAGALALTVAARSSGWSKTGGTSEASPTGAIAEVARTTGGPLLLVMLCVGLLLYAAWRLLTALMPGVSNARTWVTRAGYLVSAVMYGTFALTAVALARDRSASANGNTKVTDITDRLMSNGAGRWLVGVVGLVVMVVGLYRIRLGVGEHVTDDIDLSGMSSARVRLTRHLGSAGEIGRGIAMGLIGFFLVRAAVGFDPAQATGLDGALRRVATHRWGSALVAIVGIGLVAYGVFCIETFNRRRLRAP